MIMCMDPEHHPVLADDGRSIILHLKGMDCFIFSVITAIYLTIICPSPDDHDEQYLLGLLDNFSAALTVRARSNGEGLMHAFFETVKQGYNDGCAQCQEG